MPLYEFVNEEHGLRVDIPFPIDGRPDEIVLRRKTVPSRITVGTGAKPPTDGELLLRDYKKLEDMGQLKEGPNTFSAKTIKKAAALPNVEG